MDEKLDWKDELEIQRLKAYRKQYLEWIKLSEEEKLRRFLAAFRD